MIFFSKKQKYLKKIKKNEPKSVIEGLTGLLALPAETDYSIDVKPILKIKDHGVLNLLGDYIFTFWNDKPELIKQVWAVIDEEAYFTGAALVIKRLKKLWIKTYLQETKGSMTLTQVATLLHVNPATVKAWEAKGFLHGETSDEHVTYSVKDVLTLVFEQTSLTHKTSLCEACVFSCKKRKPRQVNIPLSNGDKITQVCSWFKEKGIYDITRSLCKFCKKDCQDLFPRAELSGKLLVSICDEFEPRSGWESAKFAKI